MKSLITFFILTITFSFLNAQELVQNGGFENIETVSPLKISLSGI